MIAASHEADGSVEFAYHVTNADKYSSLVHNYGN